MKNKSVMKKAKNKFYSVSILVIVLFVIIIMLLKPFKKYRFFQKVKYDSEVNLLLDAYAWHISEFRRVFNYYPTKSELVIFSPIIATVDADLLQNNVVLNYDSTSDTFIYTLHSPVFRTRKELLGIGCNDNNFFHFLIRGELVFMDGPIRYSDFCEPRTDIYFITSGQKYFDPTLRSIVVKNITNIVGDFKKNGLIVEGYYAYICFRKEDGSLTIVCDNGEKPQKLNLLLNDIREFFDETIQGWDIDYVFVPVVLKGRASD